MKFHVMPSYMFFKMATKEQGVSVLSTRSETPLTADTVKYRKTFRTILKSPLKHTSF
jgi:hypothetical protein